MFKTSIAYYGSTSLLSLFSICFMIIQYLFQLGKQSHAQCMQKFLRDKFSSNFKVHTNKFSDKSTFAVS